MNKNLPVSKNTKNLYLRSYKAGDGEMYYAASLRNRKHLAQYESDNVLMQITDEKHAESIVQELASDWNSRECYFIGIFEKTSGKWAGQVYVGPSNWDLPEFFIGYVADVNFEGKGYITEAVKCVLKMLFNELGAYRIKSECNEYNTRSWRLLERCGFKREGHLVENKRNPDGSVHGDYLYGLLRREFLDL